MSVRVCRLCRRPVRRVAIQGQTDGRSERLIVLRPCTGRPRVLDCLLLAVENVKLTYLTRRGR